MVPTQLVALLPLSTAQAALSRLRSATEDFKSVLASLYALTPVLIISINFSAVLELELMR